MVHFGCKSNTGGGENAGPAPSPIVNAQPPGNGGVTVGPGASVPIIPSAVPSGTGGPTDFSIVLAEDIKALCTTQGKIIERGKRACLEGSTLDTSKPCTLDSVVTAFGTSGQAASQAISGFQGQGYILDQCGTFNGKAYTTLYRTLLKEGIPAIETQAIFPK